MTLANSTAETLKRKVISGEYAVGEKLPNEQELSLQMGVSRTTIREAIKILVSKNIVTIRRGNGTYVNKNPGLLDDPLGLEFVPEEIISHDLREMRFYVEPSVSLLATRHATKKQIAALEAIIENMRCLAEEIQQHPDAPETKERIDKFSNCESLFHSSLYEMTANTLFIRLMPAIIKSVHSFYIEGELDQDYNYSYAYESHKKILMAIKSRDEQLAYQTTLDHMMQP